MITWSGGRQITRLSVRFPTAPNDDVFARMSDQQMVEFRARLQSLRDRLDQASRTGTTRPLVDAFGSDFPST
jgi:hypothetical protein